MILYLMRHGAAADRAPSGRDRDRPLTPEGRRIVTDVAIALRRAREEDLPRVLASPALRARQTAEIVLSHAASAGLLVDERDELAPDEDAPIALARELAGGQADALLVGHQPWIEALARHLAVPGAVVPSFCTALVVGIDPSTGRVVHVVDPRA
jgi:phosphohistidine phosphatase